MDKLDLGSILERESLQQNIAQILEEFQKNTPDAAIKRGVYIYGASGVGKTRFVYDLLHKLNYDVISYDAGNIRNKNAIESISTSQTSNINVVSMFNKQNKHKSIVMDEIDGMSGGDKGGINALIKLIRPKKTKKQKLENISGHPIICISNYHVDKKIKELMKVCCCFEMKPPTNFQIGTIVRKLNCEISDSMIDIIAQYSKGDLRKLKAMLNIYQHDPTIINPSKFNLFFESNNFNEDTKCIVNNLYSSDKSIIEHTNMVNDNDRTIVSLLWHENIIDLFKSRNIRDTVNEYQKIIDFICFGDYIDRITFQKQIWQLNEMSSLIKTFRSNHFVHNIYKHMRPLQEIRFTKVLTKYSTEYNNIVFINDMCDKTQLDKDNLISFFSDNEKKVRNGETECYDINNLDIDRIYRYIDQCYLLDSA